jgi:hypothetical protein
MCFITGMTEDSSLDLKSYIHFEDLRRSDEPFPYWNSNNAADSDYPPGKIYCFLLCTETQNYKLKSKLRRKIQFKGT